MMFVICHLSLEKQLTYSLVPMPNAQCPMPNAPCPMPHYLKEFYHE
ncbi:hypothetical protein [Nostoc sp.]